MNAGNRRGCIGGRLPRVLIGDVLGKVGFSGGSEMTVRALGGSTLVVAADMCFQLNQVFIGIVAVLALAHYYSRILIPIALYYICYTLPTLSSGHCSLSIHIWVLLFHMLCQTRDTHRLEFTLGALHHTPVLMSLMVTLEGSLLVRLKATLRALVDYLLQMYVINVILNQILAVTAKIAVRAFVSEVLSVLSVDVALQAVGMVRCVLAVWTVIGSLVWVMTAKGVSLEKACLGCGIVAQGTFEPFALEMHTVNVGLDTPRILRCVVTLITAVRQLIRVVYLLMSIETGAVV